MVTNQITDSDMIVLQSTESYLKSLGTPASQNPQEQLFITQQARDFLYSDIAQRVPRIASYIMSADMEHDTVAQGFFYALTKHSMDPVFINILMQYLQRMPDKDEMAITGALLVKILNKHYETAEKAPKTQKIKKGDKEIEAQVDSAKELEKYDHIRQAVNYLLGDLARLIATKCGNLNQNQALAIAACLAMNNQDTIKEIIASDMPVSAQIFDLVENPTNLVRGTLLLDKNEYTKPTATQKEFIESLKYWVYDKLNIIPTQTAYQVLVSVYGSVKPDVSKYLINPRDCGNKYPNLKLVANQLINQ